MSVLSLAPYRALLPEAPGRRVAVLVGPGQGAELTGLVSELAGDEVFLLAPAASPQWAMATSSATLLTSTTLRQVHARLKRIGPIDLLVDLLPTDEKVPGDVFRKVFFHLRPGGVYVLANRGFPDERAVGEEAVGAAAVGAAAVGGEPASGAPGRVDLLMRRPWVGGNASRGSALDTELAASCARFFLDSSFLLVEKRQRHLLKVRDGEVKRLLAKRNTRDSVTILGTLPDGELECRGEVVSHSAGVAIRNLDLVMAYPELHIHHYRGRFGLVRNSLLYGDSTVLPGSFRYPLTKTLGNPRLIEVSADFSRVPADLVPRNTLPGTFYHLDCWNTGHFGHVMTEVVSRLWGWHQAKEQIPELKVIFRRRQPDDPYPALEVNLFTAFGIDLSDIVWVDEPVWVESIVTATSMWQNGAPYYVHPEIQSTWERLRTGLVAHRPGGPSRIFVSRRPTLKNRACRNIAAVEEVFARHGFSIVFPDELTFAEQATLFGGAEVVAGFAGSGLYNILYTNQLTAFIVLSHEAYTARYEHLYTMVLGCATDYFWSSPDVPHPVGGWSEQAYYSSWEFDFARNGSALEQVLADLSSEHDGDRLLR